MPKLNELRCVQRRPDYYPVSLSSLSTGTMNMDCMISVVLTSLVDETALAAKGPPSETSHVVISMYGFRLSNVLRFW